MSDYRNHRKNLTRFARSVLCILPLTLYGCDKQTTVPPAPEHARNVILFIGDGMGVATVTAARIFDGQSRGLAGEEHQLAFERFPNVALVKTYSTNQQVSESAGTSTAMMTGIKTRAGLINVAPEVQRRDCAAALDNPLTTLGEIAKERGLAVGFVTTTRVTHATPATVYAHSPEREWEHDQLMPSDAWEAGCRDIAWQLVNFDHGGLDVAMGGASEMFFGSNRGGARRAPDADLVRQWLSGGAKRRYVTSAEQLETLEPGNQVLGLFASSHMSYVSQREPESPEPSLSQMTAAAIDLMAANEKGYFLMVEGGRIDHGHHDGRPGWAMLEVQEFNKTVETALARIDLAETLVLVTADHSHVFTLGGYATRGNPILGLVHKNDMRGEPHIEPDIAADGQPYTTLGYYNGPGAITELPRPAPETGLHGITQSLVPFANPNIDGTISNSETHGGEDVALYAIGPGSANARGVIEQNLIFDIMLRAFDWN